MVSFLNIRQLLSSVLFVVSESECNLDLSLEGGKRIEDQRLYSKEEMAGYQDYQPVANIELDLRFRSPKRETKHRVKGEHQ